MATTSLNGWVYPSPKLVTLTIPGTVRRVTGDHVALPLLVALAADYSATVRRIDIGAPDEGCYADRNGRGTPGRKSNHATGTAIDLNWSEEGAQGSGWGRKFFSNLKNKAAVAVLKRRYGSCVAWGGDWNAKDFMHWEIKPGVTRADVYRLRAKLGIAESGWRKGFTPSKAR